jgi:excisionase family DNA binding protein
MDEKFLTREEVAAALRVHIRTVERWLKAGNLKGYKLGDGKTALWRVPERELVAFLEKHANKQQRD